MSHLNLSNRKQLKRIKNLVSPVSNLLVSSSPPTPSPNSSSRKTHKIRPQKRRPATPRNRPYLHRIRPRNPPPRQNQHIIHIPPPAIRPPRHPATINLRGRSPRRPRSPVHHHLRPAPREAQRGGYSQGSLRSWCRGEGEFDGEGAIHALEQRHWKVRQL